MQEIGKIIDLKDNFATIEITPTDGCSRCAHVNICHPTGKSKKIIELPNTINAQINDWVKIEIQERNRALAIFLVLVLPIILLLIGLLIGTHLSGELVGIIAGGAGMVVAFFITKLINNFFLRKNKNLAHLLEKITVPDPQDDN